MAHVYLDLCDPPPPYNIENASTPSNSNSNSYPSTGNISSIFVGNASPEHVPSAFPTLPMKLLLYPGATSITPAIGTPKPLYELSQPIDGHVSRVYLSRVDYQQQIYKIYEATQVPRDPNHTAIAGLLPNQKSQFQRTILQRRSKGNVWEATSHGRWWFAKGDVIFSARCSYTLPQNGNLEWRDAKGRLIARDYTVRDGQRMLEAERIEIFEGLQDKMLDILVAAWCARIFQDTKKDKAWENEAEKRRRSRNKGDGTDSRS